MMGRFEGKGISSLLGNIKSWKMGNEKQFPLPFNIKAVGKNIKFGHHY